MKLNREELEHVKKDELKSIIYFLYELESIHLESLAGREDLFKLTEEETVKEILSLASYITLAKEVYGELI